MPAHWGSTNLGFTQFGLLSMHNFSPTATAYQAAATTPSDFPFQPNPFGFAAGWSLVHGLTPLGMRERAGQGRSFQHPLCQRNLEKPQGIEAGCGVGAEQDCRPVFTCQEPELKHRLSTRHSLKSIVING